MTIEAIQKINIKDIFNVCTQSFGREFNITEEKLGTNLFCSKDFFQDGSFCAIEDDICVGFIATKISSEKEVYPDTGWISIFSVIPAYRNKGIGSALLNRALESLKNKNVKRVFVGQDYNNFFSGIPNPTEDRIGFFRNRGFWINDVEHYDLEANVDKNDKMDSFDKYEFEKEYYVSAFNGEKDLLLDFLRKEFPGRWTLEAEEAIENHKLNDEILILRKNNSDEIVGYCMLTGAGTNYGGLGPIGIAESIRGRHVGDYILCESLMQLRKLKVKRVNIDWTILKDYYGQFDFVPVRIYRGAYINI